MGYLLIEESAWSGLNTKIKQLTSEVEELARHFNLDEKDEWLDNQDVCLRLNISKRTLQYYRERGYIGSSEINGKRYYKVKDLNRFLNTNLTLNRE